MKRLGPVRKFAAGLAAASLFASSAASAAPATSLDPLVALSVLGTPSSHAALTAAAGAASTPNLQPVYVPSAAVPVAGSTVAAAQVYDTDRRGGIAWPAVAVIALAAIVALWIVLDDDDDAEFLRPVSP